MKIHYRIIIFALAVSVLGGIIWSASHYHDKYQTERLRADAAEQSLVLANTTITDMQTRQRDVAALDAKYTGELADAKKQLDDLQRCVSTGKCGLRVNAKCPANGAPSTTSMDDGSSPRLTDSAERDYFTLRERIETATKQLAGLQQYVREQCLR
ncbi:lysis protein [Leclercia adecarboxylata]|uniref:lysis protein n=1 Tax=Leclercia adecarboxylata TaxID=83655 RepID=UPI0028FECC3C|nr:lysis protein [Leclercia adecarboxylata]